MNKEFGAAIDNYTPKKFTYRTQRRMEVQLQIAAMKYKHLSAVLILKALTEEQIIKIKSFEDRTLTVYAFQNKPDL